MGYHIFLIGPDNFGISLDRGVYGGPSLERPATTADVVASFSAIRPGDLAFFYVTNSGLHGLWRTTSRAFFDTTPLWPGTQVFPFRVCIEPVIRGFPRPIAPSDLLDLRDRGLLWTFDLSARVRKNHSPLTEAEGKELIRLLLRNNPVTQPTIPIANPYPAQDAALPLDLSVDNSGRLRYEGYLNAWLTRQLAEGRLRNVIGEYRDVINYVPTSFNTIMDLFLTHVTQVDSVDILHKFSCLELKTDIGGQRELQQLIKYENWLVRRLANGDTEMVQPMMIAKSFEPSVLEYVSRRKYLEAKTVRLLTYEVDQTRGLISLQELAP
jgi:hypothetical protein